MIISLRDDRLYNLEYVQPIERLAKDTVIYYKDINSSALKKSKWAIICGTYLQDFEYLDSIENFQWIRRYEKPLLGICAGAQIIGKVFGGRLLKKTVIGVIPLIIEKSHHDMGQGTQVFCLFNRIPTLPKGFTCIARNHDDLLSFSKANILAVMYHPEVMNKELISNFIKHAQIDTI
jgi:GMP synthase (glutamine-hydrolysing)